MYERTIGKALVAILFLTLGPMLLSTPVEATSGTLTLTVDTTLTEDHSGSIILGADNITLDCAGHNVYGPDTSSGILLSNRAGVTVRNCHVTGFVFGFSILFSHGNTVAGNTATGNTVGFDIGESDDNQLSQNLAAVNSQSGFSLLLSTGNVLTKNESTDNNWHGFFFVSASDNILRKNAAKRNVLDGFSLVGASERNDLGSNIAEDNGVHGFRLTSVGTDGSSLRGNEALLNGDDGFALLAVVNHVLIKNVANQNDRHGFNLDSASNNLLIRNEACDNAALDAISLGGSDNIFVRNEFCTTGGTVP